MIFSAPPASSAMTVGSPAAIQLRMCRTIIEPEHQLMRQPRLPAAALDPLAGRDDHVPALPDQPYRPRKSLPSMTMPDEMPVLTGQ